MADPHHRGHRRVLGLTMGGRGDLAGHGSSTNNGPGGLPLTITGVQLGQAQDDRWGNGPAAA